MLKDIEVQEVLNILVNHSKNRGWVFWFLQQGINLLQVRCIFELFITVSPFLITKISSLSTIAELHLSPNCLLCRYFNHYCFNICTSLHHLLPPVPIISVCGIIKSDNLLRVCRRCISEFIDVFENHRYVFESTDVFHRCLQSLIMFRNLVFLQVFFPSVRSRWSARVP